MPTKTLYVKQENVQIFEKAEKMTNSVSDLLADLLREYVTKQEHRGDIFAVCIVDERADGTPYFRPMYFVKAPVGTSIGIVRQFVYEEKGDIGIPEVVIYPLLGQGGEFENELHAQLVRGELDIEEIHP